MSLLIERIDEATFARLGPEWNALLKRSAADNFFLHWEWVFTWWSHFHARRTLFILTARLDGQLVGIAPLFVRREGAAGIRTLSFCTNELSPDYMDFIAHPDHESTVYTELIDAIHRSSSAWDVLHLEDIRPESPLVNSPSLWNKLTCQISDGSICPYLPITEGFDEHCQQRPKLKQFGLGVKWKKLQEQMQIRRVIVNDEVSMTLGLCALFELHDKRAEDKRIDSNFSSSGFDRFHRDLAFLFLKIKILNLQLLYQGDVPISAIYAFRYNNKMHLYQTGFDPAWKKYSVGGVLIYLAVQQAYEEGLTEFDFLKGPEAYKAHWTDLRRQQKQLTAYSSTIRGTALRMWSQLKPVLRKAKTRLAGMHSSDSLTEVALGKHRVDA